MSLTQPVAPPPPPRSPTTMAALLAKRAWRAPAAMITLVTGYCAIVVALSFKGALERAVQHLGPAVCVIVVAFRGPSNALFSTLGRPCV